MMMGCDDGRPVIRERWYSMSEFNEELQRKHVKEGGEKCPHCGCDEIEGGEICTGGGGGHQEMWCLECEGTWDDQYTLIGYTL